MADMHDAAETLPEIRPEFHRLGLLVGGGVLAALEKTRVIVFGLGGVGSWAAEALVRSGVGRVAVVDNDSVCVTNINRQVQATRATVGLPKAEALKKRLLEINSSCDIRAFNAVFSRETAPVFEIGKADYVIDAIDSLTHKLDLIEITAGEVSPALQPCKAGLPLPPLRGSAPQRPALFSSMGMALKLDPARLKTADIWETSGCPLARLVRQGLRKRGFTGHVISVYSDEHIEGARDIESVCGTAKCFCADKNTEWCSSKKAINGSAVTVTAAAGMILASLVIRGVAGRFDAADAQRPARG